LRLLAIIAITGKKFSNFAYVYNRAPILGKCTLRQRKTFLDKTSSSAIAETCTALQGGPLWPKVEDWNWETI